MTIEDKLIQEIKPMFDDIPFKEHNNFYISISNICDGYQMFFYMTLYNGTLCPDYRDLSLMIPSTTIIEKGVFFVRKFNVDNVDQDKIIKEYIHDLKKFIKEVKEKFIKELKRDVPYEKIKELYMKINLEK